MIGARVHYEAKRTTAVDRHGHYYPPNVIMGSWGGEQGRLRVGRSHAAWLFDQVGRVGRRQNPEYPQ